MIFDEVEFRRSTMNGNEFFLLISHYKPVYELEHRRVILGNFFICLIVGT